MKKVSLPLFHTTLARFPDDQPPAVNLMESTPTLLVSGFTMTTAVETPKAFDKKLKQNKAHGFVYQTVLTDLSGFIQPDQRPAAATYDQIRARLTAEDPILFGGDQALPVGKSPSVGQILTHMAGIGRARAYRILRDCGLRGLIMPVQKAILFFDPQDVPPLTCQPVGRLLPPPAVAVAPSLPSVDSVTPSRFADVPLPRTWDALSARYQETSPLNPYSDNPLMVWMDQQTGHKIVVKESSHPDACREEHLTRQLYTAFGVDVPMTELVTRPDGKPLMVMEWVDGKMLHDLQYTFTRTFPFMSPERQAEGLKNLYQLRRQVEKDFPIDMLLCNYDALTIHDANLMIRHESQTPCRIDYGAALRFHCDGTLKSPAEGGRLAQKLTDLQSRLRYQRHWTDGPFAAFKQFTWGAPSNAHILFRHNSRMADRKDTIDLLTNGEYVARLEQAKRDMPKVRAIAPKDVAAVIDSNLTHMLRHFKALEQTSLAPRRSTTPTEKPRTP